MFGSFASRCLIGASTVIVPQPLLHFDASVGAVSGTTYTGAADLGTLAGTFSCSNVVTSHFADFKLIPRATTRILHSAAAATWKFLHDAAGTGTIAIRLYLSHIPATNQLILGSYPGQATGVGMALRTESAGRVSIRIGTGVQTPCTSVGGLVVGWNTIIATKNALLFTLSLNGETPVSGSITGPSASDPANALTMCGSTVSATPAIGYYADCRIWDVLLSPAQIANVQATTEASWGSVPGIISRIDCEHNLITSAGSAVSITDRGPASYIYSPISTRPPVNAAWRNGRAALVGGSSIGMVLGGNPSLNYNNGVYFVDVCSWYPTAGTRAQLRAPNSGSGTCTTSGPSLAVLYGTNQFISTATQPAPGTACVVESCVSSVAGHTELNIIQDGGPNINVSGSTTNASGSSLIGERLLNNALNNEPWLGSLAAHLLCNHIPTPAGRAEIVEFFKVYYGIIPSP